MVVFQLLLDPGAALGRPALLRGSQKETAVYFIWHQHLQDEKTLLGGKRQTKPLVQQRNSAVSTDMKECAVSISVPSALLYAFKKKTHFWVEFMIGFQIYYWPDNSYCHKPDRAVFLSFSYHSVLWMDHLFNLLQLPQHWPHPHPHHQQTLQGWLHSHWCVHQELRRTVMNREEDGCQSLQFKALTHSAEYFMMSRLLPVIIFEQQTATNTRLNFST